MTSPKIKSASNSRARPRNPPRAGDEWCPVPDSEPAGPFFGVLVSGRVMVEIGPVGRPEGSRLFGRGVFLGGF